MSSKILIVEDQPDIVELLAYNLEQNGFECDSASDGKIALEKVSRNVPDLILLDLLLPRVNGLEVCRTLKRNTATKSIPIIMLTARGEEIDRIIGLELGADDYITKPFSPREVVLRVEAVLRRLRGPHDLISAQNMTINLETRKVFCCEDQIDLTATEFDLLTILARSPGRVFTRQILMESVWGHDYYGVDRTVDTHMSRLRRKLGECGKNIETVHSVGYRFKE